MLFYCLDFCTNWIVWFKIHIKAFFLKKITNNQNQDSISLNTNYWYFSYQINHINFLKCNFITALFTGETWFNISQVLLSFSEIMRCPNGLWNVGNMCLCLNMERTEQTILPMFTSICFNLALPEMRPLTQVR